MIIEYHIYQSNRVENITLPYLVYLPDDYNKNLKDSYPLVLFLHGAGERGRDLELIKKHGIPKCINEGKEFPFITVAPQCPLSGWWNFDEYIFSIVNMIDTISKRYRVDQKKIYGTGLSMGGFGILSLAISYPNYFSAIIPICGGADINKLKILNNLPIWLFHGKKDDIYPPESSILIYKMLQNHNPNIKLTIYDDLGHDSWTKTYENDELYKWLLKFTRNPL